MADRSYYILVYLFGVLLPFYWQDAEMWRELVANMVAVGIIIFLFWRFNLHAINLYFAIRGYRVYNVEPIVKNNLSIEKWSWTLITRRADPPIDSVDAYQISDTVYLEE